MLKKNPKKGQDYIVYTVVKPGVYAEVVKSNTSFIDVLPLIVINFLIRYKPLTTVS